MNIPVKVKLLCEFFFTSHFIIIITSCCFPSSSSSSLLFVAIPFFYCSSSHTPHTNCIILANGLFTKQTTKANDTIWMALQRITYRIIVIYFEAPWVGNYHFEGLWGRTRPGNSTRFKLKLWGDEKELTCIWVKTTCRCKIFYCNRFGNELYKTKLTLIRVSQIVAKCSSWSLLVVNSRVVVAEK